ncbi:HET-domain-containing protein, partial [Setomelanomma holmii]
MCASTPLYSRLEPAREEIRVLGIDTTEPQIVCRLAKVALRDNPAFAALSYTWGDASQRETILVDGCSVSVTKNLARAIRSVCYHWSQGDKPHQPRRLWADAVCINQADVKEKEHQIPLMRKVYTTASEVFVWLGSSPDNPLEAFAAIRSVAAAEATSKANASELHIAISSLFDDEYWSRVWTFQEIVLGKTVM